MYWKKKLGLSLVASMPDDDDKGVLSGLAASLAGCLGGVVGYDHIMEVLKKGFPAGPWSSLSGKKSVPSLAIGCIAGAGGRSRYLYSLVDHAPTSNAFRFCGDLVCTPFFH